MRWKRKGPLGRFTLAEATEIRAPVEQVYRHWTRYESLPGVTGSVRRIKRIGDRRVLWDVDIGGRQVVWESRIVETVPGKRVRWESTWGAQHAGEVRFEAVSNDRTRLEVEIGFRPQGPIEHLGARLGVVDEHVRRDLARFRRSLERLASDAARASTGPRARRAFG